MIIGMQQSVQKKILQKLTESDIEFNLTGSRYFGCEGNNSDYDFFTEYTQETKVFLELLGFKDVYTYSDISIERVYAHKTGNIHIQLIHKHMVMVKQVVQGVFRETGLLRPTKEDWDRAWMIIKQICDVQQLREKQ